MIDLYYSATPNGQKLKIFVEETGIPHQLKIVRLSDGEQHEPAFRDISPGGKIPALVDHTPDDGGPPIKLFESGAMLIYLADKLGQFVPSDRRTRLDCLAWLFWQVGGLGPIGGQAGHFRSHAPVAVPYAIDRYTNEIARLYGVLDSQLQQRTYLAGKYSIADMATFPWVVPFSSFGQTLEDYPHLSRWFRAIENRPAVIRAYQGVSDVYDRRRMALTDEARVQLFGKGDRADNGQ